LSRSESLSHQLDAQARESGIGRFGFVFSFPPRQYEDVCLRLVAELKAKWSPAAQTLPSEADRGAIAAMDGWAFEYHRIGYDQRPMVFRGDGTFAQGAAACERYWTIRDGRLTMDLRARPDGGWEGRWLVHEKMPILLEPKP